MLCKQQWWKVNTAMNSAIPKPTVMPLDREAWRQELHISNFINTYYQYRDLRSLGPDIKRILIIGSGQGLDTALLKWRGFEVATFDIDSKFEPDVTGSVRDLTMFETGRFDAAIASHVLEHFAMPYLDAALGEIARVARYALVYLPVDGCSNTNYRFDAVGDFNGDGKPDIALRSYSAGQTAVWLMIGTAFMSVADLPSPSNTSFEIAGPRWRL